MSESWVQAKDLFTFVLFLIAVGGAFIAIPMFVNGRFEKLRDQMEQAAERRARERLEEMGKVWSEMNAIKDNYVSQRAFDGHMQRIEKQLETIGSKLDELVRAVAKVGG